MPDQPCRNRALALFLAVAAFFVQPLWGAPAAKTARLTETQRIRHVLDRIGYGPRPGDVERVRRMGLNRYVEEQLRPESIPDEDAQAGLSAFTTLSMPSERLTERFRGMMDAMARKSGTPEERRAAQREYRRFLAVVAGELQTAKVYRAVESKRQLQEVMVDFWSNHFNIDMRKGAARALKTSDERDVARAHALGRFRDLLGASAKSPAMLVYLDNARNSAPMPARRGGTARGGLNENYARELMELHTLGVDGGYTQKDVVEVARCFTGWTVNPRTGQFVFTPRRHDDGEKMVLGQTIPAGGGIRDGERVLDILAAHPATARHIARRLCQRLAADDPPAALVNRAEAAFRKTDGDIAATVRAIVTAPEFYGPAVYRAKLKSPFEYVASSVRALDGHIVLGAGAMRGQSPARQIALMGQPLYQYLAPTGYPEDSRAWGSAGSLVARLNFAVALADGRIPGVRLPPAGKRAKVSIEEILPEGASETTRAAIMKQIEGDQEKRNATLPAALALGSPEFQHR